RQRGRRGPCDGGSPGWRGRRGCACAAGNHGSSHDGGCSAGRSACSRGTPRKRRGGTPSGPRRCRSGCRSVSARAVCRPGRPEAARPKEGARKYLERLSDVTPSEPLRSTGPSVTTTTRPLPVRRRPHRCPQVRQGVENYVDTVTRPPGGTPVPQPDADITEVWSQTLATLEARSDMTQRQLAFIKLAKPMAILEDTVFIAVPHEQTRNYLETSVRDQLVSAMSSTLGRDIRFGITVDPELSHEALAGPTQDYSPPSEEPEHDISAPERT